jgi:cytochrome c oxidase subunit II
MKRVLLAFAILLTASAQERGPRVVEITAKKFEFGATVVTLTKGEPVTLRLTSLDRAHGLMVKAFHVDLDVEGGQSAEVTFTPTESGSFPAICDHYCGSGHGNMKMTFVVQ